MTVKIFQTVVIEKMVDIPEEAFVKDTELDKSFLDEYTDFTIKEKYQQELENHRVFLIKNINDKIIYES